MCINVAGQPYRVVLYRYRDKNGNPREIYTYVLGKVTELRGGEHKSLRGFTYPLGKTVTDPNAEIGSHVKALHLIADPASDRLESFGSHPLAVLAAPQLWEPPVEEGTQPPRCWHSAGVTSLFCLTCAGLTAADLTNPEFWGSLTKPRRPRARRKATSDDFVLRLPRTAVWHKEREVIPQAA
jgi:hypothetical protein